MPAEPPASSNSSALKGGGEPIDALSWSHPAALIARWFGVGLLPSAPGTWGSVAALPCAWAIAYFIAKPALIVAAVALFFLGWWAAERVAAASGIADDSTIVVDEVVGQWLAISAAPLNPAAYVLGFTLFRVFDIWKPWPVSWAERLPGGLGVMADDALAGLYALIVLVPVLRFLGAL
ncbi:MAG TPA: phosphatidylglycerophosphatase A [Stellaceae bacterium]|nr:phosphatidylglycerophosphatase A [Stellaceae bacterium]